jgi:hypothetical protein
MLQTTNQTYTSLICGITPTGTYTRLLKLLSGIMFKGNNGYL